MEFRILGPAEVADGERILLAGAGKPTALLVRLLLSRNEVVSTDRLIDDLWGDRPPRTAQKSLQTFVSQLRRTLGEATIETRTPGYVLRVADAELDSARFEELAAAGRAALGRGDPEAASATLREALALWRGAALAGFAHERWAGADAEQLEESRLQALESRAEADLAAGRHAAVVSELEGLVSAHPLREHMLGLLMLSLYRCGRQADALAAYRAGRRQLADELGLEPMPELRELEQRILRHDPALAGPPAAEPEAPRPTRRRSRRRGAAVAAVAAVGLAALLAGVGVSMSGRVSSSSHLAAANSVVLVGADGRLGASLRVGLAPTHAIRAAGAIWTSNERDGSVSRVDAANRSVETIPVGNSPQALAFAHGYVWVAEGSAARVVAIDPAARKAVLAVGVGNGPSGLAARGDRLWAANRIDGTLTSIDARSTHVLRTVVVGPQPSAVAASPTAVWVALAGSGSAAELDRAGRSVIATVPVGNDPVAIAAGASGVWVANRQDRTVMRIDPARGAVDATVRVGRSPTSLALGNGIVWATLVDGSVAKIDERTAELIRTFPVGGSATAAVALGDGAWVATEDSTTSHRGGTLRVESAGVFDCACADPVEAEPDGWTILGLVYDRLVTYRHVGGPAGSAIVPDLAQAVPRPSDAGRTYVFRLRRGVHFSDGRLVTPGDVRASFVRLFRIKHLDVWDVPLYAHIVGARSCVAGGRCDLGRGIVADDRARTVTFHLDAPDPDFLYELTLPYASVLARGTPATLARRPLAGTGPYRIVSLRSPSGGSAGGLVLARNPRFRLFAPDAQPSGFPDRIAVRIGAPLTTRIGAVERGVSDVVTSLSLPRPTVQRLAGRHASQLHADSLGATEYLFLNTRVPPFDVPAARRAVNEAVDRARLVDLLGGPTAAAATCQILPPGFPGYRPYCPYGVEPSPGGAWSGPNLQRALRLVAESGTRGQRVQVWAPADHAPVAVYLTGVLRLLGYRASTRILPDARTYYGLVGDPTVRAQIGWVGWVKDYTSPADFLPPLFSCSGIRADPLDTANYSRLCDRKLDRRIGAAGRLQGWDPVAAQRAWAAVDRSIVDRAAAVPFANDLTLTLLSARTGGYEFNPQWGVLLDELWVR